MNRIVLIGNGFDLAHGLKTRYQDFIDWYLLRRVEGLRAEKERISDDELCKFRIITEQFESWQAFTEAHSSWNNVDLFGEIYKQRDMFELKTCGLLGSIINTLTEKKWVDIENEYYQLLLRCLNPMSPFADRKKTYSIEEVNKELEILQRELVKYLSIIDKSAECIDEIKEDIYSSIAERDIAVGCIPTDCSLERIMLISFNYTETVKKYAIQDDNCSVVYIHGELDSPESIIFGYGDEMDRAYKELEDRDNNEYLNNVKSIRYLESDDYRRIQSFADSSPFQICIMGHSCGNSDRTLLHTLFEHQNCVSIKPYYHQKDALHDDYLEKIQNISRCFNDMTIFRNRVVNKKYCKPLAQLDK